MAVSFSVAYGDTVTGNGYILQQTISPGSTIVTGNGYSASQAMQVTGDLVTSGGYSAQGVFGTPQTVTPTPSGGGGSSSSGGSGYFILPPQITQALASSTATSSLTISSSTLLTTNGSTCGTRIVLAQPIDIGLATNDPDDVKKLETFLNTYEKEKLPVNGIYEKQDVLAVKRWQTKYKANILAPMKLKNPTGTIYTSSLRQIERQTTARCGEAVIVHSCPYFKTYTMYGDKGAEVKKIQQFLNITQGEKLKISGIYDSKTRAAAIRFQKLYRKDIVSIVTLSFISGNWNVSTRTKANEVIGCDILK